VSNELIIEVSPAGEKVALLRDKKLVELHHESASQSFLVGELYLGQVKKIKLELNACFVDVGYEKDAFLHYHDLGPNIRSLIKFTRQALEGGIKKGDLSNFEIEPETLKTGKITDVIKKGQLVLVQVIKEPISSKGPRLSMEVTMAGKYFILVPFVNGVSVSKKIDDKEERKRLKNLSTSLKHPNFGLICRTAAQNKSASELHQDLLDLYQRWDQAVAKLYKAETRQLILAEANRSQSVIRDLLSMPITNIAVNDKNLFDDLKSYTATVSPQLEKVIKQYKGKEPIFSHYGIDKQLRSLFGKTVALQGGAYLVIEHTEALHVIDVNSGGRQNKEGGQDEYALQVNLEAAGEIARQLRLRDMGGIIVIDFIDIRNNNNRKKLLDTLTLAMSDDRARHTILPMSKFGLIQITRQRVRPETSIVVTEQCPMCHGSGQADNSYLLADEVENKINYLLTSLKIDKFEIWLHPYLFAYFTKGIFSKRFSWFMKYKKWIKIKEVTDFHYGELAFYDQNEEEIIFNQ
jgi:ribonuclease G